jgi:hypothetical protein
MLDATFDGSEGIHLQGFLEEMEGRSRERGDRD